MKTALDPRHQKRQKIVQDLFRRAFHKQRVGKDTQIILREQEAIDTYIQKAATEFPIE